MSTTPSGSQIAAAMVALFCEAKRVKARVAMSDEDAAHDREQVEALEAVMAWLRRRSMAAARSERARASEGAAR